MIASCSGFDGDVKKCTILEEGAYATTRKIRPHLFYMPFMYGRALFLV
jgi:hypothetical protein